MAMVRRPRMLALLIAGGVAAGLLVIGLVSHRLQSRRLAAVEAALSERDFPLAQSRLDDYLARYAADAAAELVAAQTARRVGDFRAADRHLRRFQEVGGDREAAALEIVLRRTQTGTLAGAAGALEFCRRDPGHPSVAQMIEALTRGYLAAGRAEEAARAADIWLARDLAPAERAYAVFLKGQAAERRGRAAEAMDLYAESRRLWPASHETTLSLAQLLGREKPADALPLFDELLAAGWQPFDVKLGLARCRLQLGELDAAWALLQGLRAEQPGHVGVLTESARVELARRRPAEAEALLKLALARAPNGYEAHALLARSLQEQGRAAEAEAERAAAQKIQDELLKAAGQ